LIYFYCIIVGEAQVVPITIRQLEALVRLSESLAKMRLSADATTADVEEALRLFRVSTLAAAQANPTLFGAVANSEEVRRAEDFLKRRLGVRMTTSGKKLVEEAISQGFAEETVRRAITAMVLKGKLQFVLRNSIHDLF
jgi:DNA replication licensing factor MCM5